MARWFLAYFLGCLLAAPILMIGWLLAFNAMGMISADGFGAAMAACILLIPFFFVGCVFLGAIPTPPTHYMLKGAERRDLFSYLLAGLISWGLMGLVLAILADPTLQAATGTRSAGVNVLGAALSTGIAGAVVLGILQLFAVTPPRNHHDKNAPHQDPHNPYTPGGGYPSLSQYAPQRPGQPHPQAPMPYDQQVPFS